jgi:hypothetical protein
MTDADLQRRDRADAEEIARIRAGNVYAWDWWLWLLAAGALWQLVGWAGGMIG